MNTRSWALLAAGGATCHLWTQPYGSQGSDARCMLVPLGLFYTYCWSRYSVLVTQFIFKIREN